ncbi:MAG: hypothetical protein IKM07_01825 [Clostridia bacterium]|nr:hypothetical protein [Clostridia bacterium]
MKYESLGYPCRNFCFFEIDRIPCDPLDGREKVALSTCVHGGTARIIILDPEKDAGECYDVPQAGEMAAWGLLYLPDYGKLLAGTCARGGYLCSLDLATRKWDPSVNIPGETYFWNLTRGGDGLVYGTSYPGCIMFRYDPATGILDSAGRVGDDPENLYTRPAMTLPNGNVIIGCGCHTYHMYCYDVKDHTFTPFGQDGELAVEIDQGLIVSAVQYGDIIRFYDAETLLQVDGDVSRSAPSLEGTRDPRVIAKIRELIEPPPERRYGQPRYLRTLADGTIFGISGQEYFLVRDGEIEFRRIPVEAPPTGIFQLAADENDVIWFSTGLGQTIGRYNPADGSYWNSPMVTEKNGEVYGIVPYRGLVYLAAYSGGDHVVYDPNKPWNMRENRNPVTLESVGKIMVRPIGRSILGPDSNIWTGWSATYGRYGGGITRINTETHEVAMWHDMIPEQSYGALAAGREYIYVTTNGSTSGRPSREDCFFLLRLDTDGNIVQREQFELGQYPEHPAVIGDKLFLALQDTRDNRQYLRIYCEKTLELIDTIEIGERGTKPTFENTICSMGKYDEHTLIMFVGQEARLVDAESCEILQRRELPAAVKVYAMTSDKSIYVPNGSELLRFRFDD